MKKERILLFSMLVILALPLVRADTIFFDGFESGNLNGWNLTGTNKNWSAVTTDPHEGLWHTEVIQPGTGEPASIMQKNISSIGFQNITFRYYRKLGGLDAADRFGVAWFNGSNWSYVEYNNTGGNIFDPTYYYQEFNLTIDANNNQNFQIKFECTAGAVSEFCRVDNVTISGTLLSGGGDTSPPTVSLLSPQNATTITTNSSYFAAHFTDNVNVSNTTLHIWNSTSLVGTNFTNLGNSSISANLSFTLPREGTYFWNYQAFDNSSNSAFNNTNFTLTFTLPDTTPPSIDFVSPTEVNGSFLAIKNILINVTASDSGSGLKNISIKLYNSTGLVNETTITESPNYVNFSINTDGTYYFNATAYDNDGNVNNTETRTIVIDTIKPEIEIVYPQNNSNQNNNIEINYTVSDLNLQVCWWTSNNGIINNSIICGNNITGQTWNEGSNTIKIYANDTAGNQNSSSITFTVDTTPPSVTSLTETPTDPAAYLPSQTYQFNATITDDTALDTILFSFNGTNYTTTNISNIFTASLNNLGAGNYNYRWYANDTSGNVNQSETGSYTINKATPAGSISGTSPITYGTEADINGTESNNGDGDIQYKLYRDGFEVSNPDETILAAGTYNYIYNSTEGQNYTANSSLDTFELTINQNAEACEVLFNETSPIIYPQIFSVWSNCNSDFTLKRNGDTISNNSIQELAAGDYNFTVERTDAQNYSNIYDEKIFTINQTLPQGTLNNQTALTLTYGNAFNFTFTESNEGDGDVAYIVYRNGIDATSEAGLNITLGAGTYEYVLNTTGGQNYSTAEKLDNFTLTVNQATGTITLLINSTAENQTATYGAQTNVSASISNEEQTIILLQNGEDITSSNNFFRTLAAGDYNFTANAQETQNYTALYISRFSHILKATSGIKLELNGTQGNITIEVNNSILVNGTLITGDNSGGLLLYNNGTLINNNTIEVSNLTQFNEEGLFNITLFYIESQNYTQSFETWFLNITESINLTGTTPIIKISYPSYASTYGNAGNISLNFSAISSNLNSCWYSLNNGNNVSLIGCANTTFNVSSDGIYNITVYANESISGLIGNETLQFHVNNEKPVIHLLSPKQNHYTNSSAVNFSYIPSTNSSIERCELWGDFSGTYSLNQTNSSAITSGQESSFTLNLTEGNYLWAILCNDIEGKNAITGNRTLTSDFAKPNITNPASVNFNEGNITLTYLINDSSPVTCTYNVNATGSGQIILSGTQGCQNTILNLNFIASTGEYASTVNAQDAAGNVQVSHITINVQSSPSDGGPGGGGGGSQNTIIVPPEIAQLEFAQLEELRMRRGQGELVSFEVTNTGTKFLNRCKLQAEGSIKDWISNRQVEPISPGQKVEFIFTLNAPPNAEAGKYNADIKIVCDEITAVTPLNLNVLTNDFEFLVLSSRKNGNRLDVDYILEDNLGKNQDILIKYAFINPRGISVLENEETVSLKANERKNLILQFELPKNSVGEFILKFTVSNERDSLEAEHLVSLPAPGLLTGLVTFISEENKRALSIFAVIILIALGAYVTFKFIYKHNKKANYHINHKKRKLIELDIHKEKQFKSRRN